jgi:hypothetical protein
VDHGANLTFLRGFEVVGGLIWLAALGVTLRRRRPYVLGMFVACNLMIFWDWIFNSKWFFNVTYDDRLLALWTVQGVEQPLAAALAYVAFYFFVLHAMVAGAAAIDAKLGRRGQYPVIYAAAAVYVLVFESIFVSQGVWTYHQREAFTLNGVAWSNAFFNAHLILSSYVLLRLFRRWGAIDDTAAPPQGEAFWKELVLAVAAISTGFFLSFVVQALWYIAVQPWAPGPRPF